MALTRDFKVTVRERLQRDPSFREALLEEAVDCFLAGDVETGKSLLRDHVNATIGFVELGGLTDRSPISVDSLVLGTEPTVAKRRSRARLQLQQAEGLCRDPGGGNRRRRDRGTCRGGRIAQG